MTCQVLDYGAGLTCTERESGGVQCEVLGEHTNHAVSDHTIKHSLSGNGYSCQAIDQSILTGRQLIKYTRQSF